MLRNCALVFGFWDTAVTLEVKNAAQPRGARWTIYTKSTSIIIPVCETFDFFYWLTPVAEMKNSNAVSTANP